MEFFLRFLIISAIWTFVDSMFKKPFAEFFETDEDGASCLIAVILGGFLGYYYLPIIAFSLDQKSSSWTASICMIISSFIFNGLRNGSLRF